VPAFSTECLRPSSWFVRDEQQHDASPENTALFSRIQKVLERSEEVARFTSGCAKSTSNHGPTTDPIGKFSLFLLCGKAISSRAGIIRLRSVVFGYNVPVR